MKSGPEVSFVGMAFALSSARKRLTRAGAGPDSAVIGPSGKPERVGPSADAGKEMALVVSGEVARAHVNDASLVNVSARDEVRGDEVSEPLSGIGVNLVIVGSQHLASLGVNRISMYCYNLSTQSLRVMGDCAMGSMIRTETATDMIDPACVPDTFCEGVGQIERLAGDCMRLTFFAGRNLGDGNSERMAVARIVIPLRTLMTVHRQVAVAMEGGPLLSLLPG